MTTADLVELTREKTGHDCSPELYSAKPRLLYWLLHGSVFQRDGDTWFEWPPEA